MTPRGSKAKGRLFQNKVAADVRAVFCLPVEDCRPAIMGEQGCDLKTSSVARAAFPFGVEAKKRESLNVWTAMAQATANAEAEGLAPVLVFSRNRSPAYACLRWEDFLDLAAQAALGRGK